MSGKSSHSGRRDGPIRCGVVGVGRMGRHHARVYGQHESTELVGIVDDDRDRAETIIAQHGGQVFETAEAMIAAGVDAVSIAVPTTAHVKSTVPFLEAGVACLVEKPLAGTVEDAWHLKETASRTGSMLMVGHIERFNPIMRALRRAQEQGPPIVPRFIEVHRVSPMTFRSVDTSVVMDMMIHDLDVVLMLMNGFEPTEIHASGVPVVTEHEDICNARLVFDIPETGRCVANVTASRLAFKTERVTRITGDNAYIKVDYQEKRGSVIRRMANELQMDEVRDALRNGKDLTDLNWSELVHIEELAIDVGEPIVMEIEAFLDAYRTGQLPEIDAEAGFVNVRTAERIIQAARADRESWKPRTELV